VLTKASKNFLARSANKSKNILEGDNRFMRSIARILFSLAAVLVLGSISRAEVLKIVVDDTVQPITQEYI